MTDLVKELREAIKSAANTLFRQKDGDSWESVRQLILCADRAATALDRPVDGEPITLEEIAEYVDPLFPLFQKCVADLEKVSHPDALQAGQLENNRRRVKDILEKAKPLYARLLRTPPAEPSEAQVEAAMEAYHGCAARDEQSAFRAALIAAGVTGRPGVDYESGHRDGIMAAIGACCPHEDDDAMDKQVKHQCAEAIAKLLEPSA